MEDMLFTLFKFSSCQAGADFLGQGSPDGVGLNFILPSSYNQFQSLLCLWGHKSDWPGITQSLQYKL